jgi:hypothetical protein
MAGSTRASDRCRTRRLELYLRAALEPCAPSRAGIGVSLSVPSLQITPSYVVLSGGVLVTRLLIAVIGTLRGTFVCPRRSLVRFATGQSCYCRVRGFLVASAFSVARLLRRTFPRPARFTLHLPRFRFTMAIWNKTQRASASSDGASPHSDPDYGEKTNYKAGVVGTGDGPLNTDSDGVVVHADHSHLHRGLKSRHITMIAIGGAIGTGLIIGTGKALAQSGYVFCSNHGQV